MTELGASVDWEEWAQRWDAPAQEPDLHGPLVERERRFPYPPRMIVHQSSRCTRRRCATPGSMRSDSSGVT
jgi:hypothetical protein